MSHNNNHCAAVRIIRLLHAGWTGTRSELAKRVFVSERTLDALMPKLHRLGLARIVAWQRHVDRGAACSAVYGFGEGKRHARKPTQPKGLGVDARYSRRAQEALAVLRERGEVCASDLMEEIGLSRNHALQLLATLRCQNLAHIARYHYTGLAMPPIPMYVPGAGRNALKPVPFSNRELKARRRRALTAQYGPELARRILNASTTGVTRIVENGKTLYERKAR